MCLPAIPALGLASSMMTNMAAAAAVTTAVSVAAAKESAAANAKAIDQQNQVQAIQISQQAGQQESIAANQARQARAQSIVAAGGAGIDLGSNSFIGSLQTTTMNQQTENGLILDNEKNSQAARQANAQSLMNQKATSPTFLGAALDMALAGTDSVMSSKAAYDRGTLQQSRGNFDSPTPGYS